jgi:hypothetical protein
MVGLRGHIQPVDTWEGISGYHDFELHVNGDTTAWRSYQVGMGKRFAKADLDAKYKMVQLSPPPGLSLSPM